MYFVIFLFLVSVDVCNPQSKFPHQIESISQGQNCSCRCIVQTEPGRFCPDDSSQREVVYSVQTVSVGEGCKCTCLTPPPPDSCQNRNQKEEIVSSSEKDDELVGSLFGIKNELSDVNIVELQTNLKQTIKSVKESLHHTNITNNRQVLGYLEAFGKYIDYISSLKISTNNFVEEKNRSESSEVNPTTNSGSSNILDLDTNSTSNADDITSKVNQTTFQNGAVKSVVVLEENKALRHKIENKRNSSLDDANELQIRNKTELGAKLKEKHAIEDKLNTSLDDANETHIKIKSSVTKDESREEIIIPAILDLGTNSSFKKPDNQPDILLSTSPDYKPRTTTKGFKIIEHSDNTKDNLTNISNNDISSNKTLTTPPSVPTMSSTNAPNRTNYIIRTIDTIVATTPHSISDNTDSNTYSLSTNPAPYASKNTTISTNIDATNELTTAGPHVTTVSPVPLTTSSTTPRNSSDNREKTDKDEFDIGKPVERGGTKTIIFNTNSSANFQPPAGATEQRSTKVDDFDVTTTATDARSGSGEDKNEYYTEDDDVGIDEYYQDYDDDVTTTEQTTTTKRVTTKAPHECGTLFNISRPQVVHDFGRRVGSWMMDAAYSSSENPNIYVTNFYYGNNLIEFKNLEQFKQFRWSNSYMLPYNWIGTGHVVYNGSFYFSRAFSKNIIKYNLRHRFVSAWGHLRHAMYDSTTPLTWKGHSRVHMAVDESGLWVMYPANSEYDVSTTSQTFIINQLDVDDLHTTRTWRTTIHKKSLSHVFMVCGVVYFTDRYDSYRARITHAFDTYTGVRRDLYLPFLNRYAYNVQMLFLPKEGKIISWDKGHQVIYNVNLTR